MTINEAVFAGSSTRESQKPSLRLPEFAFIGRSNVGKSSLINMLCGNSKLAKTSSTPGKTKLINHFRINGKWYLVDLPGYGFAKISKTAREELRKMINDYITRSFCSSSSIQGTTSPGSTGSSSLLWARWACRSPSYSRKATSLGRMP